MNYLAYDSITDELEEWKSALSFKKSRVQMVLFPFRAALRAALGHDGEESHVALFTTDDAVIGKVANKSENAHFSTLYYKKHEKLPTQFCIVEEKEQGVVALFVDDRVSIAIDGIIIEEKVRWIVTNRIYLPMIHNIIATVDDAKAVDDGDE